MYNEAFILPVLTDLLLVMLPSVFSVKRLSSLGFNLHTLLSGLKDRHQRNEFDFNAHYINYSVNWLCKTTTYGQ